MCQHVMVPKAENSIALLSQEFGATLVSFCLCGVLTTIDFNDSPGLYTTEVDNITTDRMLTAKFNSIDLSGTKVPP